MKEISLYDDSTFSFKTFTSLILIFLSIVLITLIFYIFPIYYAIFFSIAKIILFIISFKLITHFFPISSKRWFLGTILFSGILLFSLPYFLNYILFGNFRLFEESIVETVFFGIVYTHKATWYDKFTFRLMEFCILIAGPSFVSLYPNNPYSYIKNKPFEKTFKIKFNKYNFNYYANISEWEEDGYNLLNKFLKDLNKHSNSRFKRDKLILFELDGDSRKILRIGSFYYLLNKKEYLLIKNYIKNNS